MCQCSKYVSPCAGMAASRTSSVPSKMDITFSTMLIPKHIRGLRRPMDHLVITQTPSYSPVHQTLTIVISAVVARSTNSVAFDPDEAGDQLGTVNISAYVAFAPL